LEVRNVLDPDPKDAKAEKAAAVPEAANASEPVHVVDLHAVDPHITCMISNV